MPAEGGDVPLQPHSSRRISDFIGMGNGERQGHGPTSPSSHHHHHHVHGPHDKKKAMGISSLGFEPVFNVKFNEKRALHAGWFFNFVTFVLPLCIGLCTAFAAWGVGEMSEKLGEFRTSKVHDLVVEHGFFMGWLAQAGLMTLFALVGGFAVYAVPQTKSAGSSGIPQLIGLLNGCDLKGEFSAYHMIVKWFGVSLAVASGLAVGPEGPMIFIGSCMGFLLSKALILMARNKDRTYFLPPRTVSDDVFVRDYTSIGAACGIAAAFRAPIAGTLFIVEEAASHFKKDMLSNIFMGGLASLEVILLTGGAGSVLEYKVQTGTGCSSTPWWTIFFCAALGVVCGGAGALFNWLNVKVMTWRQDNCNATMRFKRATELVILCLISSTFWIVAPALFSEQAATTDMVFAQSDGCLMDNIKNQVITGSVIERDSEGSYLQKLKPAPCLYGIQYNPDLCPKAFAAKNSSEHAQMCVGFVEGSSIRERSDYQDYCCNFTSIPELMKGNFQDPGSASCALDLGETVPSLKNSENTYNSMAALTLVPFKTACQNLFARGMPHLLSWESMLVFLILFFVAAAVTAGSAIPSGLLMPQMVIGGLIGRLFAILAIKMQLALSLSLSDGDPPIWASQYLPFFSRDGGPLPVQSLLTPDTDGFLDPGIAAVVGAAAFLGGSGRVTLFTTVMMVEITGDPIMIFPVGFATIFAVVVGNKINHGLYHALIDVQSTPYLPDTWDAQEIPEELCGLKVKHMMPKNDPICVENFRGKEGIQDALERVKHATRNGVSVSKFITNLPLVDENEAVVGMVDKQALVSLLDAGKGDNKAELEEIADMYPLTVRETFPLQMAYQLFKAMDMKNLIVVNREHKPVSVMTRFAFLAWRVEDALKEYKEMERQRETADPESPNTSGLSLQEVRRAAEQP